MEGQSTKTMDAQVQSLQHQRRTTQVKVFTKWVNCYLAPVNLQVNELIDDMSDGIRLFRLIELISGQSLGRANPGAQRFQRMDNISKCLNFLSKRIPIKHISAEDIVGGNANAILALLWLIFVNLQMTPPPQQPSHTKVQSSNDDSHNKVALLKWCQLQLSNYPGVQVTDFGRSWSNGLAFNALIHHFRPDLVAFEKMDPNDALANLNNAFHIADQHLAIPRLLEAKDVVSEKPDEDSILIYVAYIYKTFYKPTARPTPVQEMVTQKRVSSSSLQTPPPPPSKAPPTQPRKKEVSADPPPPPPGLLVGGDVELVIFPDSWECNYCTFMNTPVTQICGMCFTKRPDNAVLAKDKDIQPTTAQASEGPDSDDHEWTEDDEILRRPGKSAAPRVNSTRISITLEQATEDATEATPLASNTTDDQEEQKKEAFLRSYSWQCHKCGFNNPPITKICGSCFLKRLDDVSDF